ncbi:MAG: PQQ-binding-like beta-propeller repeat protein [Pirellulales bacterium]
MKSFCLAIYILLASFLCSSVRAQAKRNWPQFRGPDRTDISKETNLLQEWPEGGPKKLWHTDTVGIGYSGPAIVDDRLFIMGAQEKKEFLYAINANSGEKIWETEIGTLLTNNWGNGPRGTPTVNGQLVYALSGQGNLVSAQASDGKVAWTKSMKDLGGNIPRWGYTESVLVDGDQVVCTPGGNQGALAALNKYTGEIVWQSEEFTDGAQYASVITANINGNRQYIQLTMKTVVGIRAKDGKLLWKTKWPGRTAVVPTPIFSGGKIFVSSGYSVGCKLLEIGENNGVTLVYDNNNMTNHHGGVLLLDGNLYGYSDSGGWTCMDFETGEVRWKERRSLGKGALTYADGRLYCLSERNGDVVLAAASSNGWKEHGRFTLEPQTKLRKPSGKIWTHPVVVGGKLYLRDQELLFCYDVRVN